MHRRTKAAKVEEYLNENRDASLREVSQKVGVAPSYVSKVRKRLEEIRAAQASKAKARAKTAKEETTRPIRIEPPPRATGLTIDEAIEELRQAACVCPRGGRTAIYLDLPGMGPVALGSITTSRDHAVLLSPR